MRFWKNKKTTIIVSIGLIIMTVFLVFPEYTFATIVSDALGKMAKDLFRGFSILYLTIAAKLLWVAGIGLNYAITFSLNIKDIVDNLPGIRVAWTVIRDIITIFFIFILLYTSILVIIGKATTKEIQTLIIDVVVAGFFINFSLVIVNFIIDITNVIALGIYSAIIPANSAKLGISDIIMNAIQGGALYSDKVGPAGAIAESISFIIMTIMMGSLMLVTAILFIVGAGMFILRTIKLIGIMVVAPFLAFNFVKIGPLKELSDRGGKLWGDLISAAMFAPMYMLIMYMGLKILVDSSGKTLFDSILATGNVVKTDQPWTIDSMKGSVKVVSMVFIGAIINYAIIMGFFMAALATAKKAGIEGSEKLLGMATKWIGKVSPRNVGRMITRTSALPIARGITRGIDRIGKKEGEDGRLSGSKNTALNTIYTAGTKGVTVASGKLVNKAIESAQKSTMPGLANPLRQLAGSAKAAYDKTEMASYTKTELDTDKAIDTDKKIQAKIQEVKDFAENISTETDPAKKTKLEQDYNDKMSKLSDSEKQEGFKMDDLTGEKGNPKLVAMLGDSYINAMKKKDGVKESDIDKLEKARVEGIATEMSGNAKPNKRILEHFKKLDGDNLLKLIEFKAKDTDPPLHNDKTKLEMILKRMTSDDLKKLGRSIADDALKFKIADTIRTANGNGNHMPSAVWLKKPENRSDWGI